MIIQPMPETEAEDLDFEFMLKELRASDLQEEISSVLVEDEDPFDLDGVFSEITEKAIDDAIQQSRWQIDYAISQASAFFPGKFIKCFGRSVNGTFDCGVYHSRSDFDADAADNGNSRMINRIAI